MIENPQLVLGVTSTVTVPLFVGQASRLRRAGFDVTIISSPGEQLEVIAETEGAAAVAIPMKREISPFSDSVSLTRLVLQLRRSRPVVADFGTPKAGLLGGIAGWLTAVPVRVYTLRGLRQETTHGVQRALLWVTEWLACRCAHRVYCVSPSLRRKAIHLGLVRPEKAVVLGCGSSRGVEVDQFLPTEEHLARAEEVRRNLNLPRSAPVIGFVGRLTRDKGIPELLEAYRSLRLQYPELRLLLIGDFEEGDPVPATVRKRILEDAKIIRSGFVPDASPYYHLMEVLVLPTYREGFPSVPLEAQAAGKPVVTTTATGAIDSIQDGKTGLLVPVGDATALAQAIGSLLADPAKREAMGREGQEWVAREFAAEKVRNALVGEYRKLMQEKLGPAGGRSRQRGWPGAGKRSLDILGSALGLMVLSPVMAVVALSIRITMGKPILFRHIRPGLHAQPFSLLKFRTMREAWDEKGRPLPDRDRLTRLGIWLRKLSLDELPQFWNVLRGDMSLVGPRPLLMEYLARYTPEQRQRHLVKPGITGWAQIHGRQDIPFSQRIELDNWYVSNSSLWLDLSILFRTTVKVFSGAGVRSGQDVRVVDDLKPGDGTVCAHTSAN